MLLFMLLSIELSLPLKSRFMLDIVGVGQSLSLGWNRFYMLFLMGGFKSWIERMFYCFSSFLPLLLAFDVPCFLAW
jgi:hypothetical protein